MPPVLVFQDPVSRALLTWAVQIARGAANVLITGEPGTGKSLLAREIHARSPRSARQLHTVDCASDPLPETERRLQEAFQVRGATLLLDNVADMPPAGQTRLTHALSRERPPLADDPEDQVRIIATSSVPLEAVVSAGRFRSDLYHRLRVAALEVPPLRSRPNDIVPLVLSVLNTQRRNSGAGPDDVSPDADQLLRAHRWPGNITELAQRTRCLAVTCRGRRVETADLPWPIAPTRTPEVLLWGALARIFLSTFELSLQGLWKRLEHTTLRLAYHHCGRSQAETARLLGLSRNVVRARLLEMGEIAPASRETAARATAPAAPLPPSPQ